MQRIKRVLFLIAIILLPHKIVNASIVNSVDMEIKIDKEGTAIVKETWETYVDEGTEGYHPYYNIGNSEINLISASMDEEEYEIVNNWNVKSSLKDKAYKAAIYKNKDEIDICFGITNYGTHTYTINYSITNFILKSTDSDIIYWTLFPNNFSNTPKRISIKIYNDQVKTNSIKAFGYGNYGGNIIVQDNYINFESSNNFSKEDYVTLLVKFPKDTFDNNNISNKNFNYYYDMAEKGANNYTKDSSNIYCALFIGGVLVYVTCLCLFLLYHFGKTTKKIYKYSNNFKKLSNKIEYYKEIPCNKDIYRAYFIAVKYKIIKKKENLLSAVLLQWYENKSIKIEKKEGYGVIKSKSISNIVFIKEPNINKYDTELYNWMKDASIDGKLKASEFKKWCSTNYARIISWFDEVIEYEANDLAKENLVEIKSTKRKYFNKVTYILKDELYDEAKKLKGFSEYLKSKKGYAKNRDNSLYLMFLQLLGIEANIAELNYPSDVFEITRYIAISGAKKAYDTKKQRESSSSSSSSHSSGGGGTGSFGGGSGGGGFR